MNETELIQKYFAPLADIRLAKGLNDDAAELQIDHAQNLVITSDNAIEGRHFTQSTNPKHIAQKALRRNISDLIAKGATPLGFVHNIALPTPINQLWLESYVSGLKQDSIQFAIPLLGGDTSSAPLIMISITAIGTLSGSKMVLRKGARAGDLLCVSGTIGDAAIALKLGEGAPQALKTALNVPHIPFELQDIIRHYATASIDISDGFYGDTATLLGQSNVSCSIPFKKIPLSQDVKAHLTKHPEDINTVLSGGDDYQTLFTISSEHEKTVWAEAQDKGIQLTNLGIVMQADPQGTPLTLTRDGEELNLIQQKFSHF